MVPGVDPEPQALRCSLRGCEQCTWVPRGPGTSPHPKPAHKPHHRPWLVSLSLATTAGICFASSHGLAWIVSDLPSSVVWESRRGKASICGDTMARAVCSGSTASTQSQGIG